MTKGKTDAEKEAVMMALDQISQTMDVMRQVVGRLKRSIEDDASTSHDSPAPARQHADPDDSADQLEVPFPCAQTSTTLH